MGNYDGRVKSLPSHNTYRMLFAGISFIYRFMYAETAEKYQKYVIEKTDQLPDAFTQVQDFDIWEDLPAEKSEWVDAEYKIMVLNISRFLLSFKRCVCHAAAIQWNDRVWLFTAKSGTGKTTLYENWKKCFGDQVKLISGDMPFVECRDDGSIWVYSSPWNGKENYPGEGSGKLGGILYLQQGNENRMKRLSLQDAVLPVFKMFLVLMETSTIVEQTSYMTEQILRSVPVWEFTNTGDVISARKSNHILQEYLDETK